MSNGRVGCINRDINSVKNMKKIVDYWFETGLRLEKYSRTNTIPEKRKPLTRSSLKQSSKKTTKSSPLLARQLIQKNQKKVLKQKK